MSQLHAFMGDIAPLFWAIFFVLYLAWNVRSLDGPGGLTVIFLVVAFGPLLIYEAVLGGGELPVFVYSVIAAFVIVVAVFFKGVFKK